MPRWLWPVGLAPLVFAAAVELAILATPLLEGLTSALPPSVEFVDRGGQPFRLMLADERRFSQPACLAEISPALLDATLSAEDKRFRHHPGVDPLATLRAIGQRRSGHAISGASTISQQLIKLVEPGPRTLARKLREIWLALKLEQTWSKDRILIAYLNRLEYGHLRVGIAAASQFYFGKTPADLSPAEAAFLAGLPRAPSRLDPYSDLAAARARQQWVLGRMRANQRLDAAAYERARSEPLKLQPPTRQFQAPHFVDLLLRRKGLSVPADGVVRTTLDLELNRFIEEALARNLAAVADRGAGGGAVVVMHNPTSEVLALAGSGDYFEAGAGQVNGAWIERSPGSAVKPFTYLLALENGAEPGTVVPDVATTFATETGLYRPNNYNHRFYGPVSLRFALGNSLNVGAIRTLELGGGSEALHRLLRRCGVTSLGHPARYYGLGLTLGNGEVRLLELTNAYAALARLGVYRPARVLRSHRAAAGARIAARETSWQLADMLSDNAARSASFGPRSFLSFDFPVAAKTGTSSDYRDNWTMAFTPEFTVGVWVGNPDGASMRNITGVTGAAPVMHEVMTHLHQRFGTSWYERPRDLARYSIDPLTGRGSVRPGARMEWGRRAPEPAREDDYDAGGRVRLSGAYQDWLAGPQNTLGNLVVRAETAPALRILEPAAGSVYYIDHDLPAESQWIPLRAESSGRVIWSASPISRLDDARFFLAEGRHALVARDLITGARASTWIEVRAW